MVRPGDGNEIVYSPIHVNATLHCVLDGPFLLWLVDGLNFVSRNEKAMLNLREIFEITESSSKSLTSSTLTVYGDIQRNNNISICCETREDSSCTTLIIYGISLQICQGS